MGFKTRRASTWWIGAAAFGLLLAASEPARAATSVRLADGSVLTVEELRSAGASRQVSRRPSMLSFSLESPSGTRAGLVGPTVDAAPDTSPLLALDPRSGDAVLIWSRHDGVAMKLAWARFVSGAWTGMRFLTFGRGDDRAPAVGISLAGSYLFWRGEGDSVLYAPIDLGEGRLFAAPSALPIDVPSPRPTGAPGNPDHQPSAYAAGGVRTEGNEDIPVIIGIYGQSDLVIGTTGNQDIPIVLQTNGNTDVPVPIPSPSPAPNGNGDAPVIIGYNSYSSPLLSVVSDPSCHAQVLLLGSPRGRALLAVEFAGSGSVSTLGRVAIPPGLATQDVAAAAGLEFLEASCR